MIEQIDKNTCLSLYKDLKLTRRFDETTVQLKDKEQIAGPLHPGIGMEAIGVGIAAGLQPIDFVCPTHRTIAAEIAKGADVRYLLAEYMGKRGGYVSGKGGSMHNCAEMDLGIFSIDSVIGSRAGLGAGIALASKLRGDQAVTVAFFGDGGINEGIVAESMNMAAIWNLPILFVCENNQYGYTTSYKDANAIDRLSDRAQAFGFEGQTIDGMDVVAVYLTAQEKVQEIRSGTGPFLLECEAFGFEGHWSGEKQQTYLKYRTKEEVAHWKSRCPVQTFHGRLVESGICTNLELDQIDAQIESTMEDALAYAQNSSSPEPEEAMKFAYATEYKGIPQPGWIP